MPRFRVRESMPVSKQACICSSAVLLLWRRWTDQRIYIKAMVISCTFSPYSNRKTSKDTMCVCMCVSVHFTTVVYWYQHFLVNIYACMHECISHLLLRKKAHNENVSEHVIIMLRQRSFLSL